MTPSTLTSRRSFLKIAGATTFALSASGGLSLVENSASAETPHSVNVGAWVTLHADDRITIRFASAEMGQGVSTALPMILAEELDADWAQVSSEQVDKGPLDVFGNPKINGIMYTAGSTSVEGYFERLRQAGAQVRRVLIHSVAAHWDVPVTEITTEPSILVHSATDRKMGYGQAATTLDLITEVPDVAVDDLKNPSEWRIIGTDVDRLDVPAKTRGETEYSIDVRVPGMLYAAQLVAPVEGETPVDIGDADAMAVPGVVQIIPLTNSVNVLAETFEAALFARDLLDVAWSETSGFRPANSETELATLKAAVEDRDQDAIVWEAKGDAVSSLSSPSAKTVTSVFTTEQLYHAQMEPLNATASVDEDGKGAEVWIGTQSQTVSIGVAAGVLQTTPDKIRIHAMQMGGAFGRRTVFARELLRDALLLSKISQRPVKLMWTREDDVRNGWFRPASAHRISASLDESGNVTGYHHRLASPSVLQFALPQIWENTNGRDLLVMEGAQAQDYDLPNLTAEHVVTERQSKIAAWRGIGWGPICYARECFIDELAAAANSDPVSFRRKLLAKSNRGLAVLNKVLEMSDFGNAPEGRAHGLSFAGYKGTRGAGVAEISLDADTNEPRFHKFWAAVDPGIAVHPKNVAAQVEGGVIFGLSGLHRERISVIDGQVDQNNFYDYEVLRSNEVPEVFVEIIQSGAAPSGVGEIGVPMTGGAVANAIFALTGSRPHNMPFNAHL